MESQRTSDKLRLVLILATSGVAAMIVLVTRDTSGLKDLATLIVTVAAVVRPSVGRRPRRRK
jgi:hypothetical protein